MSWTVSFHVGAFVAALVACLAVITLLWPYRESRDARALLVAQTAIAGWVGTATVQLASNDPALIVFLDRFLMLFVAGSAISWCLFAIAFTDTWEWVTPSTIAVAVGIPILTQLVVWTNPRHGLMFSTPKTRPVEGTELIVSSPEFGPWFVLVHAPHSYGLALVGGYLIARFALSTWTVYRGQAIVLLIAMLIPTTVSALGFYVDPAIDYTSLGFAASGLCFTWGLYRYELLDLAPIARGVVVDEMRDAVVVIDLNGRIVDHNAAATDLFETGESVIGQTATDVVPFELSAADRDSSTTYREVELAHDGETRQYRWDLSEIEKRNGAVEGRLLVAQDITELKRREAQLEARNEELEILNRIVRHDIQNDMNVVLGHAQVVDAHVDDHQTHVEAVIHSSEHVIELTETVRELLDAITGDSELTLEAVTLDHILHTELEKVRRTHETATFVLDELPDRIAVRANPMLSSVFANLLTNAVRHNDTDSPTVTIDVGVGADTVTVRVADDGPGVPDEQKDEIFGRGEKGLESPGSGIGLYLVDTLVEQYGGSVHVEDNEPRGAVFVVELQRVTRAER